MPLYIALGGALGSLCRYWLGGAIQRAWLGTFPMGTLVVNLTGCFLIGLFLQYALDSTSVNAELRVFLTIGFCGGYTTFSSYSWETLRLLQTGEWGKALVYSIGSVVIGLLATAAGMGVSKLLPSRG